MGRVPSSLEEIFIYGESYCYEFAWQDLVLSGPSGTTPGYVQYWTLFNGESFCFDRFCLSPNFED